MRKKSLAAAVSLVFATGFAYAQGTSSEVKAGSDNSRAEQILKRSDHSTSGQSSASRTESARGSSMESSATTRAADGRPVPVPEGEVRMSTDESRADDILQRARQMSDNQQTGTSTRSSGDSGSSTGGAAGASGSSGSSDSTSGASSDATQGAGASTSGSSAAGQGSGSAAESNMGGHSTPDERGATAGSSATGK